MGIRRWIYAVLMVIISIPFFIIGSLISMVMIKIGDAGYWLNHKGFDWSGR